MKNKNCVFCFVIPFTGTISATKIIKIKPCVK